LFVIPLFFVVVVFAVANHGVTELNLWPLLTEPVAFPVYGIALGGLFVGFVLGHIVSWLQSGQTRRRVRELQRQLEADQQQIAGLRSRLARLEMAEKQATIPPVPATTAQIAASK
jgi:uncharacterized integral membrane protein